MLTFRSTSVAALLLSALALGACAYSKPNPTDPSYLGSQGPGGPGDPGSALGGSDLLFGNAKVNRDNALGGGGGGLGVNAYLWRGALDTLGFMPLA